MNLKTIFCLLLATFISVSCKKEIPFDSTAPDTLFSNRDTTANLKDDFFSYANGGWFKQNPIPASELSNGIFRTIQDTINDQIKQICEKSAVAKNLKKGSNEQKIGDFYASGMDTISIDKTGINPLKNELSKIDAIKSIDEVVAQMAFGQTIGVGSGFSFYVSQDDKLSTKYAVFLSQGGLGLGNRDYYFNTDTETTNIRNAYVVHLEKINSLFFQAVIFSISALILWTCNRLRS